MKKIALTQGKFALVDDEDYKVVKKYTLFLNRGYVCTWVGKGHLERKLVGIHRLITNCPKGKVVDHINHNKLDNRIQNLRIASSSQNNMNQKKHKGKSMYKGVSWDKWHKQWSAQVQHKLIGYFDKEHWAAMAYDIFAKEFQGEFAVLNFKAIN